MTDDMRVAALMALARHGVAPDIQETLTRGDGRSVPPGALDAAMRATLAALPVPGEAEMVEAAVWGCCVSLSGRRCNILCNVCEAHGVGAFAALRPHIAALVARAEAERDGLRITAAALRKRLDYTEAERDEARKLEEKANALAMAHFAAYEAVLAERDAARAEAARLREALSWCSAAYEAGQFMRAADFHSPDCRCLRCAMDNIRGALAKAAP